MELIRVDAKITDLKWTGRVMASDYETGDLVDRGDFLLVNPDKFMGIEVDSERNTSLFGTLIPYQWFVYLLLGDYPNRHCIGECIDREHAQQVIDELPTKLTG